MAGLELFVIAWLWILGARVVYILTTLSNGVKPGAAEAAAVYLLWPVIWTWAILRSGGKPNVR